MLFTVIIEYIFLTIFTVIENTLFYIYIYIYLGGLGLGVSDLWGFLCVFRTDWYNGHFMLAFQMTFWYKNFPHTSFE